MKISKLDRGGIAFLVSKEKRQYLTIDQFGISFPYHGDEVIWLWPWKREQKSLKFVSVLSEGTFASLEEVKKFWKDYNNFHLDEAIQKGEKFKCITDLTPLDGLFVKRVHLVRKNKKHNYECFCGLNPSKKFFDEEYKLFEEVDCEVCKSKIRSVV